MIQSLLKIKVIISICLIVNIFLCGEGNIVSTNCLLRITQINQIANCRFLQFITITGWFCGFHFRIAFKQIPHHKMLRSNIKCTIEKMLIYFRGSIGKCSYCFCNGFFDNTIAVWKYKNPTFLKLLYHKNTKTAIPLYQNCGFCLAEKEGIVSCTQHRILFLYSNYNAFLKKNRQYRLLKSSPERAGKVLENKVYSLFIVWIDWYESNQPIFSTRSAAENDLYWNWYDTIFIGLLYHH